MAFSTRYPDRPHDDPSAPDLRKGLLLGARNMIGIAVACASAGVIVGTVTLTGMGRARKLGIEQGYKILAIELPNPQRPSQNGIFILAGLLVALIWFIQSRSTLTQVDSTPWL